MKLLITTFMYFIISYVSNNNMVDLRNCDVKATLALFNAGFRNYVLWQIIEKYATFIEVIHCRMYDSNMAAVRIFLFNYQCDSDY